MVQERVELAEESGTNSQAGTEITDPTGGELDLETPERSAGQESAGSGRDAEDDEQVGTLPESIKYDILKNSRRRLVLKYLFSEENPASLGSLSEHVAGIENDKDPQMLKSQERKRVYVGLYQCHLPRMHDADVIEFNKNRGVVELGPHAEELLDPLQQDETSDVAWPRVYLLCSLFGTGLFLLTQSPILGIGWLGPPVLGLTLFLVATISLFQLRDRPEDE